MKVLVSKIEKHDDLQPRLSLHLEVVDEYVEAMLEGAKFPPVTIYKDKAGVFWLADGYHRVAAAQVAGHEEIEADVRAGSFREAVLFSMAANSTHGLPRSNEDKRRVVRRMVEDDEWGQWSDRKIAAAVGLSHTFVARGRVKRPAPAPAGREPSPENAARVLGKKCAALRDELVVACRSKVIKRLLEDELEKTAKVLFQLSGEET